MREEESCGKLVVRVTGPVVEDADEAGYCLEGFCYAAVGGRGEEVPGRGEDDFADDVGGEIVACDCRLISAAESKLLEDRKHTP